MIRGIGTVNYPTVRLIRIASRVIKSSDYSINLLADAGQNEINV